MRSGVLKVNDETKKCDCIEKREHLINLTGSKNLKKKNMRSEINYLITYKSLV